MLSLIEPFEGRVLSGYLLALARKPNVSGSNPATILAMCRDELSAVITRLMSKFL